MALSANKDLNELLTELRRAGWRVERVRKHFRLISPAGRSVYCPTSPSDYRSIRNVRGKLRRAGASI